MFPDSICEFREKPKFGLLIQHEWPPFGSKGAPWELLPSPRGFAQMSAECSWCLSSLLWLRWWGRLRRHLFLQHEKKNLLEFVKNVLVHYWPWFDVLRVDGFCVLDIQLYWLPSAIALNFPKYVGLSVIIYGLVVTVFLRMDVFKLTFL